MTRDDVFAKLKDILVTEFEIEPGAIQGETELYTDLDLDSIDSVDLVVKMKEYASGKVDPSLFKSARTVDDVVNILYPLVSGSQA